MEINFYWKLGIKNSSKARRRAASDHMASVKSLPICACCWKKLKFYAQMAYVHLR